jgi:hypothetical protein
MVKQSTVIRLMTAILYARRNSNVRAEQASYTKLCTWCVKHNMDLGDVMREATDYIKRTSIAASMNGIV